MSTTRNTLSALAACAALSVGAVACSSDTLDDPVDDPVEVPADDPVDGGIDDPVVDDGGEMEDDEMEDG